MTPELVWDEAYALDVAAMDATHREFISALAGVRQASDAALLPAWEALVQHTQGHFEAEDRWMLATRFAATNCHSTHHKAVLDVMREGLQLGRQGHLGIVRQMADELASWFPQHAHSMDAALADHLRRAGYDTASGAIAHPQALPAETLHGCGGACAEQAEQAQGPDHPEERKP